MSSLTERCGRWHSPSLCSHRKGRRVLFILKFLLEGIGLNIRVMQGISRGMVACNDGSTITG